MQKILLSFMTVAMLALTSACATTANYQQVLANWQGQNIQDLIKMWGDPDAAIKLPSGNTTYMYTRQQLYTAPGYPTNQPPTFLSAAGPVVSPGVNTTFTGNQTVNLTCRTWFETNPQGIIVNSRFEGNNCVSSSPKRRKP